MLLKLIENLKIENTKVTVEYKEQNEQVNKILSGTSGGDGKQLYRKCQWKNIQHRPG